MRGSFTIAAALTNVSVASASDWILNNLNAQIGAGEVVFLQGDNGAGKTTLLQVIATLQAPRLGHITWFDGQNRYAARPHVGLLGHAGRFYAALSGFENLALLAQLLGLPPKQVAMALEHVGLDTAADRPVATYSAGMKQRLQLARLRLQAPRLLLLDEPWSVLDGAGSGLVDDLLTCHLQAGSAVVLTSHHAPLAQRFASRLWTLQHGQLWL